MDKLKQYVIEYITQHNEYHKSIDKLTGDIERLMVKRMIASERYVRKWMWVSIVILVVNLIVVMLK
jgi:hypothetical protein